MRGLSALRSREGASKIVLVLEWARVAKGFAVLERFQTGKEMLVRIVAMLTKLVERFDPDQSEGQKAKGRRQKLFVGPPTRLLHSAFCLLTSAFP